MTTTVERTAESNQLLDVGLARVWAGFLVRAVKRRWFRWLLVAATILGLTGVIVSTTSSSYFADTIVLARRDTVSSQTDASRTVRPEDENPTNSARAVVLRDENLRRIADQVDALDTWTPSKSATAKFFSFIKEKVLRQPTVVDRKADLLNALRDAIVVSADAQELTIAVTWNDPDAAIAIANQARKNFLEDRRQEIVGQAEAALSDWQEEYNSAVTRVAEIRDRLGYPEDSEAPLPDASPLREALLLKERAGEELQRVRVNAATAFNAFKFRFADVREAEGPAKSVGGRAKLLLLGILGAFSLATLAAVFADLAGGRITEAWQVERRYGLSVLSRLESLP